MKFAINKCLDILYNGFMPQSVYQWRDYERSVSAVVSYIQGCLEIESRYREEGIREYWVTIEDIEKVIMNMPDALFPWEDVGNWMFEKAFNSLILDVAMQRFGWKRKYMNQFEMAHLLEPKFGTNYIEQGIIRAHGKVKQSGKRVSSSKLKKAANECFYNLSVVRPDLRSRFTKDEEYLYKCIRRLAKRAMYTDLLRKRERRLEQRVTERERKARIARDEALGIKSDGKRRGVRSPIKSKGAES